MLPKQRQNKTANGRTNYKSTQTKHGACMLPLVEQTIALELTGLDFIMVVIIIKLKHCVKIILCSSLFETHPSAVSFKCWRE